MANIFVACPTYDGRLCTESAFSLFLTATRKHSLRIFSKSGSLLAYNCNAHWVRALNERNEKNFEWFALLHSDIEPDEWWLDTLIDAAERHHADAISAVIPVKDSSGATSTAISRPGDPFRCFTRLTSTQVNDPRFPETFDIHSAADALESLPEPLGIRDVPRQALLLNTGCFVCRLNRPWCEQVHFLINDTIQNRDGQWKAGSESEDWCFSRQIAERGGLVMATKTVRVRHWGWTAFDSAHTWGNPRDV